MASTDSIINIDAHENNNNNNNNNIASSSGGSIITSRYNEEKWREEMKGELSKKHDPDELHHPVCIFQVPKSVKNSNPEAYTPQTIALGPHHHFLPKLYYKMQNCKLYQVQVLHELPNFPEFQLLVDQIKAKVRDIRGYYLEHLDIHDDTLSWIMMIDALFLLQLIYREASHGNENSLEFADSLGRKIPMDAILRDVMIIENQIPFLVLEHLVMQYYFQYRQREGGQWVAAAPAGASLNSEILQSTNSDLESSTSSDLESNGSGCSQPNPGEEMLNAPSIPPTLEVGSLTERSIMLCKKISPIELQGRLMFKAVKYPHPFHLLDLLYNLVWFGKQLPSPCFKTAAFTYKSNIDPWSRLWSWVKAQNIGALSIPIKIIELVIDALNVLGISVSFQELEEKNLIPTASQMSGVKVNFCNTSHCIKDIAFEKEEDGAADLHLPVLQLNAVSEVVIRNLLAYETIARPYPPHLPNFARYMEMMAAMIHTVEDVQLLKNKKILKHDGDNGEVVKLFSRIKSSIQSEGESSFDSCIKDLNEHYDNHWKIKVKRLTMKYLCSSWKILTIFAVSLLLVLMALQTFCSIYSCHGLHKTIKLTLASSL